MLTGLMFTAFLMGLGGIPHCVAMCGTACAAAFPRGISPLAMAGRCIGYAVLGAVAASAAGLASQFGRSMTILQPFWVMLQVGAVFVGLWLLWYGVMPRQLDMFGVRVYHWVRSKFGVPAPVTRSPFMRALVPLLSGCLWAVLPCGLLYAAVVVAALAPNSLGGALVMLAFALPGAAGIWFTPQLLRKLSGQSAGAAPSPAGAGGAVVPILWHGSTPKGESSVPAAGVAVGGDARWAVRLSGLCLSLMAAWAVWHQLVAQWQAWCA
ncbi:MAG: sulfite exporter TauE/SafE family protein [Aquabacterium sp.]|uniref:urease accessory protein UreH domain-containing protein n=1 Tax=Aquabacterium sp. TaxID=1872578 RepID=UPI003BED62EA